MWYLQYNLLFNLVNEHNLFNKQYLNTYSIAY